MRSSKLFRVKLTLIFMLISVMYADLAQAQVQLGVSYFDSLTHASMQRRERRIVSGSLNIGITQYARIGFTKRIETDVTKGRRLLDANLNVYENFRTTVIEERDSADLFIVLYHGLVSPFIFGGVVHKRYKQQQNYDISTVGETVEYRPKDKPAPNAGVGLSIPLNYNLSIRISRSWSPGKEVDFDGAEHKKLDVQTDVSLNYQL